MDDLAEATRRRGDVAALRTAVAMYLVVLAAKLGVYLVTGVLALLAEAMHTLSDLFISGFLLVAVHYARRREDQEHMFGHGRAENVAALVAATLFIAFTSYNLYVEAVPRLFAAQQAEYHNLGLAVAVLLGSMALAAVPLVRLLRRGGQGPAPPAPDRPRRRRGRATDARADTGVRGLSRRGRDRTLAWSRWSLTALGEPPPRLGGSTPQPRVTCRATSCAP